MAPMERGERAYLLRLVGCWGWVVEQKSAGLRWSHAFLTRRVLKSCTITTQFASSNRLSCLHFVCVFHVGVQKLLLVLGAENRGSVAHTAKCSWLIRFTQFCCAPRSDDVTRRCANHGRRGARRDGGSRRGRRRVFTCVQPPPCTRLAVQPPPDPAPAFSPLPCCLVVASYSSPSPHPSACCPPFPAAAAPSPPSPRASRTRSCARSTQGTS